jgi:hypothetical protein
MLYGLVDIEKFASIAKTVRGTNAHYKLETKQPTKTLRKPPGSKNERQKEKAHKKN